jgi:hypothetical protein
MSASVVFWLIGVKYSIQRSCSFLTLIVGGKIFKTNKLHAKYSIIRTYRRICWPERFADLRKILISIELHDAHRRDASQNIVKERLTRKIFRNKDLALPFSLDL